MTVESVDSKLRLPGIFHSQQLRPEGRKHSRGGSGTGRLGKDRVPGESNCSGVWLVTDSMPQLPLDTWECGARERQSQGFGRAVG